MPPCRLVFLTGTVHPTARECVFSLVEWTVPVRLSKKVYQSCLAAIAFRSQMPSCRLVFLTGTVHPAARDCVFSLVEWTAPVRKTRRHGGIWLRKACEIEFWRKGEDRGECCEFCRSSRFGIIIIFNIKHQTLKSKPLAEQPTALNKPADNTYLFKSPFTSCTTSVQPSSFFA